MYKYKKLKHAYEHIHTQTFASISAHSLSYTRTLYTVRTHKHTRTHAHTHTNTHTYSLAGIHVK